MAISVNGELIDDDLIRQEMASLRPHYEAMMQDMEPVAREMQLKDWSKENLVERVLLRQEAMRSEEPLAEETIKERMTSLMPPPGDGDACETGAVRAGTDQEALRSEALAQLRLEQLVARVGAQAPKPRKQDALDFYKQNQALFALPAMIEASHIVKNVNEQASEDAAREGIEQALRDLDAGQTFAEVADRYSDCAGQGGKLGWFPAGEMVEEFDEAVFALHSGGRSGIFQTSFGFHIALVHAKRDEGTRPFNDVREEIEARLAAERRERALEEFVDKLKEAAVVKNERPAK